LSSISTDTQSSTQSTDTIKPRAKGIYGGEWDLRLPANNPKELLDYSYNYDIADHSGVAIAVESSDDESDARRGPPTDKEIAKRKKEYEGSILTHYASQFITTPDDVTEMHFKEGSIEQIKADTDAYSAYLQDALKIKNKGGTDIIGARELPNHGLHFHVDIENTFHSDKSLGRFFVVLFNVTGTLANASRVNENTLVRRALSEKQIKQAQAFLDEIANPDEEKLKRIDVMPQLKDAIYNESLDAKFYDVNLEHSHFGNEGTIEIRALQSPARPKDIHTLASLIDKMVAFAKDNPGHEVTKTIKPESYSNIYAVLDLFCGDDLKLRQELQSYFEALDAKPVAHVGYGPEHPQTLLEFACKKNDLDQVEALITANKVLNFTIDGADPFAFAQHKGFTDLHGLLEKHGVKGHVDADIHRSFYTQVEQLSGKGLDKLHIARLMRHPDPIRTKVINAIVDGASVEKAQDLLRKPQAALTLHDRLLSLGFSPKEALNQLPHNLKRQARLHLLIDTGFSKGEIESIEAHVDYPEHEFNAILKCKKAGLSLSDIHRIVPHHVENTDALIEALHHGFNSYEVTWLLCSAELPKIQSAIQIRQQGFSGQNAIDMAEKFNSSQLEKAFKYKQYGMSDQMCMALATEKLKLSDVPVVNAYLQKEFKEYDAIRATRMNGDQQALVESLVKLQLAPSHAVRIIELKPEQQAKAVEAAKAGYPGAICIAIAKGNLNKKQQESAHLLLDSGVRPQMILHFVREYESEDMALIIKAKKAGMSEDAIETAMSDGANELEDALAELLKSKEVSL
tara:strand:+ start:1628 stop:4015 length:2388 start_codon:yes stop_codon:yes gene_type:complete